MNTYVFYNLIILNFIVLNSKQTFFMVITIMNIIPILLIKICFIE